MSTFEFCITLENFAISMTNFATFIFENFSKEFRREILPFAKFANDFAFGFYLSIFEA
jgi:hypothetical protein